MKHISLELTQVVMQAMPLLLTINEERAAIKPATNKWSFKEIMGHLIDSANNNQQKFVRTMAQDGVNAAPYQPDEWVAIQHYNAAGWEHILALCQMYNTHMAHVIDHIHPALTQNQLYIGEQGPFTLEFIVTDYLYHMKHHLRAILTGQAFLK